MKRYTRYFKHCMAVDKNGTEHYQEGIYIENGGDRKLFDLENLEEELGLDLITLFEAFSKGSVGSVYKFVQNDYSDEYKKGFVKPLIINYFFRKPNTNEYQLSLYDNLTCKNYIVDVKDYGKTWALTKEELENK